LRRSVTELREAAQRILWHWKLLALCTLIGLGVPLFLSQQAHPTYVASMRLLASNAEVDAAVTADNVAAIATSRVQVVGALDDINAERDPDRFAKGIAVRSVGNSGMVDISVTDEDPIVAATFANAVTSRVVEVMRATRLAKYPLPTVIDSASAATTKQIPTTRAQDIVFGGLLGLVLGMILAALAEAFNPTLIGGHAIGDELGAPVLGVLPRDPDRSSDAEELPWVRWQLGAQAEGSGISTVELTSAGPSVTLAPLAAALDRAAPPERSRRRRTTKQARPAAATTGREAQSGTVTVAERPASANGRLHIHVLDRNDQLVLHPSGSVGVVVVVPSAVKRTDMDVAKDLLDVTGWPAIGVIAYRRGGVIRRISRRFTTSRSRRSDASNVRRLPWRRAS
jgi:capsular polysaccharide biosynthesis protein